MTQRDESAMADADRVVPSTRRSRRDGEREAEHRALYAESAQPSSSMRVVDGGSPMYRTRREMRESASQLARDLPVIVEPTVAREHAAAPATTAPAGRRARRLARTGEQPTPAEQAAPIAEHAAVEQAAVSESTPADAVETPAALARSSRRARRLTAIPSVPESAEAPQGIEAPVAEALAVGAAPEPVASAASTPEPAATNDARVLTRAERRAAQAAGSDEVSAAVAAVLGSEQADVASTPVRSPLRREVRPPRQAVGVRRPAPHAPVVRPSRRARSGAARTAIQRLAAAGVILSIGSFVAVTSLPAQAFSPSEPTSTTGAYGDVEVEQQLDVTTSGVHGDEQVTAVLTRDDFGVDDALASARIDAGELAALQTVADGEEIGPYYGGDPAMPEVWAQLETTYTQSPFPSLAEVPVSSGFGYRWGSFHGGVDLVPGAGTPVFPVANGVVVATWQGNNPGGGGYEVIVEHNIDGQYFQSWYPHLQAGSILVEPGQVVDITTQLGAVGSTGRSTGAHLHLEIKNGDYISVDPLVWLATREQILEP